jgi:hypothetical protein
MANETIKINFSLLDEGRKYTGHHRKYILESARTVCYSPETREGIQLREKFGFLGHGRRVLAGKLQLGETELVKLPGGQSILLENIPSNVTTFFEVAQDGRVEHHQELLLENDPGKTVFGLHKSRVGGFSWACGGYDGAATGSTKINSFEGFDYVLNPGFSANRGYILESAGAVTRDVILENIEKLGVTDPEQRLESWSASVQFYASELEERLAQAGIYESIMEDRLEKQQANEAALAGNLSKLQNEMTLMLQTRERIITECARQSVVAIPDRVQHAMISMANESDFHTMTGFFESARRIDLNQFPVPGSTAERLAVPRYLSKTKDGFGVESGIDFDCDVSYSL